ncbi:MULTISPECIES: flagellar hook protein FlgE [Marinobacter]|uniref:Flagellar hook protein FlgE n=1 Tax=Marinobacter nauticus TaxID=2743 RepID=A0A833N929_MARNT|nr:MULTISPECIES: flagellar hook protein FlgE [Marinobacter]KAE8545062.1 Flagellar hook protein FlgE [Marinobacter nauticus]MAC22282.1 flagellar biosynthesis protein FlgE [Marinobacter sp.]MBH92810.1 flagellar biosynthesis protein FlgE [Marinobacter sp.]HCR45868.1 flagellar biosynthesis protein FlgE [Marinobacter nauticus]|tara:strand:- start:3180 stop:5093 length:1914 start_codon:yes stop_codon:yes gene_type:complete
MAFNTGLSGLRAASVDLDVTGNNIANASTVGFKSSKVQFGDLYASGFLSAGTNPIGDGVRVQDVKQSFGQGNISFTDNGLDMAISGDGFFILNNGGEIRYSRAGQFGIDKEGYVVNNQNMRVQGYTADDDGNLSGIRGDLQIETDNLAPRRTTNLQTDLNLDSREAVLERRIRDFDPIALADLQGSGFTFGYSDGTSDYTVPQIDATASASDAAIAINAAPGVTATARTAASLTGLTDSDVSSATNFRLEIRIDGSAPIPLNLENVSSLEDVAEAINDTSDNAISASVVDDDEDPSTPDVLRIIHSGGQPLEVAYGDAPTGTPLTNNQQYDGEVFVTTDRNVEQVTTDSGSNAFEVAFNATPFTVTNEFNPIDQRTYNHATSTTIFDSLGNSHELTQFYVKEPSPGNGVGQSQWSIYLQIDGELVGGTDQTPYTALFDQDGQLESINGDPNGELIITDWVPKDPSGDPNGADGPPANPGDVVSPIPEPATSSAFVVNLANTTQYGAAFGVNDQQQNGYTTGRLSGLDVSDQGVIFARYTNGQSKSLGQVALAAFNNTDGLSPVGDTTWVETFESGQPVIGAPDTGTLGSIKASSVEDSNVDLSAELVNLIIAQRNYQANAKTIETSDAVTQTIINLR